MYKKQENIDHAIIQSRRFTDHEHYKTSTITSISTIIMATAQIINCLVCMVNMFCQRFKSWDFKQLIQAMMASIGTSEN